jgi:polysaccharide export outer membrane protein
MHAPETSNPHLKSGAFSAGVLLCCTLALSGCVQNTSFSTVGAARQDPLDAASAGQETAIRVDSERLAALARERRGQHTLNDYPIGPGDVVQVSVPRIEELRDRTERISGDGALTLPLLGTVQAAGLTEDQLRAKLRERLSKYMRRPQIDVFVKEYQSRQVAVIGSVKTPRRITLTTPNETILDAISAAGGLTNDAGDKVFLIPARRNNNSGPDLSQVAISQPQRQPEGDQDPRSLASALPASHSSFEADALTIMLRGGPFAGTEEYMKMPLRPGDVIIVPGGGDVMVVGWVPRPGQFKMGSGLTVLGAVGAAGGPMYAANTTDVRLIRTEADGVKKSIGVNLDAVTNGTAPDTPVQANDVIDVPYSNVKIGPYILYSVIKNLGYGLAIPAIP